MRAKRHALPGWSCPLQDRRHTSHGPIYASGVQDARQTGRHEPQPSRPALDTTQAWRTLSRGSKQESSSVTAYRWCLLSLALSVAAPPAHANAPTTTETVVLIRHAEKPPNGLGQLNCQGLNRALALPAIIRRDFGKPALIFAPNPADPKTDDGTPYDYIRPLATIEPTAIAFAMPVQADIGVADWGALAKRLEAPALHSALVLVAWEHSNIVLLARALVAAHAGNPSIIPDWNRNDFDSIYVLRITRTPSGSHAAFMLRHEGLDHQSTHCPGQ